MHLKTLIEETLGDEVVYEPTDEGATLINLLFRLEFSQIGERLSINYLEVMEEAAGIARAVIDAIHRYCEELGLVPVARRVFPDKEAFWQRFGYVPDDDDPDCFVNAEFV